MGVVYFIKCDDYVKIGYTDDVERRMNEIRTHVPTELVLLTTLKNATRQTEREMHVRFAHLRHRGEWFLIDNQLMAVVDLIEGGCVNLPLPAPRLTPRQQRKLDDQRTPEEVWATRRKMMESL